MEGAHPAILRRLQETNLFKTAGYGLDPYSESARRRIRLACGAEEAEVYFLSGGTQTNATAISAMLRPWQGVVAAHTGHIAVHEAGAVEAGGHKVLTLQGADGKLSAAALEDMLAAWHADDTRDHTVMPGMVYLSQPTEYGTLYSLQELSAIRACCDRYGLSLYADGARLAYALACPENDVSLADLARLCDAFYIGGTKCGALFGEALVFPRPGTVPHFFTLVKQHGALLAKGWIAGLQFDVLFTDGLYMKLGQNAVSCASRIRAALIEKGYALAFPSPTNQLFPILTSGQLARISEKAELGFWENRSDGSLIRRIATSWATTAQQTDFLISVL